MTTTALHRAREAHQAAKAALTHTEIAIAGVKLAQVEHRKLYHLAHPPAHFAEALDRLDVQRCGDAAYDHRCIIQLQFLEGS